jgi:hypothetical protein
MLSTIKRAKQRSCSHVNNPGWRHSMVSWVFSEHTATNPWSIMDWAILHTNGEGPPSQGARGSRLSQRKDRGPFPSGMSRKLSPRRDEAKLRFPKAFNRNFPTLGAMKGLPSVKKTDDMFCAVERQMDAQGLSSRIAALTTWFTHHKKLDYTGNMQQKAARVAETRPRAQSHFAFKW